MAKLTLKKFEPRIIGITGSVGKTSTKNAVYVALKKSGLKVRMAGGNLNNETGLPLAIIGDYKTSVGFWFLTGALWKGFWALFSPEGHRRYPEVLILEYGADKPGDMDYLLSIARPDIAILTAVGEIPVHVEAYSSAQEVLEEKKKLVLSVPKEGAVILNSDEERVFSLTQSIEARVKSYGFSDKADLRITTFKNIFSEKFRGSSFYLEANGEKEAVALSGIFGRPHAYACAAGAATALMCGVTLKDACEALGLYKGERGRGRIIDGLSGTTIIDESYNASPDSTAAAIQTLGEISAKRKIAVIGDMLELGDKSDEAHEQIGRLVGSVVNLLIVVGEKRDFLMRAAASGGLKKRASVGFATSRQAADYLIKELQSGDLILIKGSQSIRTEKIVKRIMARPEEAKAALVRQYGKWLKN